MGNGDRQRPGIVLVELHMTTLEVYLEEHLGLSNTAQELKPLGDMWADFRAAYIRVVQAIFPPTGYGQYFKDLGLNPLLANGLRILIINLARTRSIERRRLGPVVEAIRFLARGDRQKRTFLSRANVLLNAANETSIIDEIFAKAGLNEAEFLSLLKAVVAGGGFERERVREIAAAVVPALPCARGLKVSAASASHELFLELIAVFDRPRAYAWSGYFVDRATKATQSEFANLNFDPRPAYRRFRKRRENAAG